MKIFDKKLGYKFICDICEKPASLWCDSEEEARLQAIETARRENWKWKHPGWVLYCSKCFIKKHGGER